MSVSVRLYQTNAVDLSVDSLKFAVVQLGRHRHDLKAAKEATKSIRVLLKQYEQAVRGQ